MLRRVRRCSYQVDHHLSACATRWSGVTSPTTRSSVYVGRLPGWTTPSLPTVCPHPVQVARLLEAVRQLPGRGPHLYTFFGCMYYVGMRPAEVICLNKPQCRLPSSGWGLLDLKGGIVTAGKERTDDGAVLENRSLKRRATKATRPLPVPPVRVRMLRDCIARFGVAADGASRPSSATTRSSWPGPETMPTS